MQGSGSVVGGVGAAWLVRHRGELGGMAVGIAAVALGYAAMTVPVLALVLACAVVFGAGFTVTLVAVNTALHRRTPGDLLGRVSAAADMVATMPQIGSIAAGAYLVGVLDYRVLFAAMAVITLVAAVYLWLGRASTMATSPQTATAAASAPAVARD